MRDDVIVGKLGIAWAFHRVEACMEIKRKDNYKVSAIIINAISIIFLSAEHRTMICTCSQHKKGLRRC